jgi:pimeloyl-ACP methyl ester carboxylesterase
MNSTGTYRPRVAIRSAKHSIRRIDYHVSEWGESGGRLLVLLHGLGDTGSCFQFLVDQLLGDKSQEEYLVIAPDWRGFGQSQHSGGSYWFPDYLADLHQLLELYSPRDPVCVLGHSMGGNIAGLYAGIFPERVAAFINVEGFGLPDADPDTAPANYRRWIDGSRETAEYPSYRSFDELAARIVKRNPAMQRAQAMFVAQHWASQSADGSVRLRADPTHKLPNAVLYRRAEAEACWNRIASPVLLVMGENSSFLERAKSWLDGAECTDPYPSAPRAVIAGAGHMVHFEQPALLAATVETFLQTL